MLPRHMKERDRRNIEKIISQLNCQKNFKCAASDFENLCKAEDIGLGTHLLCHDSATFLCGFSLRVDQENFCSCPVRVYLARHLGK